MSFDFSDTGYVSRNGKQSPLHREHAIHSSAKRGSFFNLKASPKRMEKIIIVVFSLIGYGSVIGGILLNLANWKSDVLFISACLFMALKLVRYILRMAQSYRREEIEQQILKKKLSDSED